MATKAEEQRIGTFAKAADDEPIFVLRAQDKDAPKFVRAWAKSFMDYHVKRNTTGREQAKAIIKHTEALEIATAMESWHNRKQAD